MINVMVVSGKFVGQMGKAKFISKDTVAFFPQTKKNEKVFLLAEDVTIVTSKPKMRLTF